MTIQKALILNYETQEQCDAIAAAYNSVMSSRVASSEITRPEEWVNTDIFKQMMIDRGYSKLANSRTRAAKCRQFGIEKIRSGKEWHYNKAQIERIPKRC